VAAADQQVVHRVRRHRIIGPEAFDVPADRRTSVVRKTPVTFYSEGVRLVGDIYYPDDLGPSERRAGIVLCHGYTGVKDLYLPDNARVLTEAGYVVMTFDYKGWGDSGGARSRLAPYSRVADAQAALTFLETLPEVDAQRLGIYGTSYGGATVVWTGAIDRRVKCVVSVVGIGDGARWMRSVRRPDEFHDLLQRAAQDRKARVLDGTSAFVKREEILLPDRQSAELAAAARRNNPAAVGTIPLEYIDETLQFAPEWVVDRIAPRPVLFITTDDDRLVPPEESFRLYARAGEPKKLVVLEGYGHYEVYTEPAFHEVMRATVAWYRQHLPARAA
jgi:dipeptidyl aminopeptidase/acylaminoacyl peptidase